MDKSLIRLHECIDYLKDRGIVHKQQDIVDIIGMDKGRVSDALKGKIGKFTKGFLKRFASAFSDYINEDWLLTGEGRMEKIDATKMRPHIPLKVSAGYTDISIGSAMESECETRSVIPGLSEYDFTIEVQGDSMIPMLLDGDTIACEWVYDLDNISDDKIYVLDTKEGAVVKQIRREGDEIICRSLNNDYKDFCVPYANVTQIARVVGVIRNL